MLGLGFLLLSQLHDLYFNLGLYRLLFNELSLTKRSSIIMATILKILVVEDSEDDALLVLHQIKKGGYDINSARVDTPEKMKAALKEKTWDIILSDYQMPHFSGLDALALYKESGIDIPFIVISRTIGEEVAVDTMKAGAHDYIMKNNLQRLLPAIERELRESKYRAERKLLEQKQKQAEIIMHLQSMALESAANGIVITDKEGTIIWVNPAFTELTGYMYEEIRGQNLRILKSGLHDRAFYENLWQTILNGKVWHNEMVNRRKDGILYTEEMTITPVQNHEGEITNFIAIKQNITERKRTEEEIQKLNQELEKRVAERTLELRNTNTDLQKEILIRAAAEDLIKHQLQEKEILLKEIHHRVKNNMQIIISMLNLQASFVKNKKIVAVLQDGQSRIKTMALIHEKLYQTKNFASIDFTEYLNNLSSYLFTSYKSQERQIEYFIDIDKYTFDIDKTIALGLIANELITNSFKYAFIDGRDCIIGILLKKINEKDLVFSISDNGKGLPENFDYRNSKTLGIQLVYMLTEQINGKLELTSSNLGTTFSIIFPYKNE